MSGAPRAKTSPKQGPLRATIPISAVAKEGCISPQIRPPQPQFPQPDPALGRRSPGAPFNGAASKGCPIRKTASLDSMYVRGLFPRENIFWHRDRATQTDLSNSLDSLQTLVTVNDVTENKLARLCIRQRRRSCSRDSNTAADQASNTGLQVRASGSPNSKSQTKSSRSSEEGLNQEIESYIAKSESDQECDRLKEPTPEGRKAPVADLLRSEIPFTRIFPHNSSDLPLRDAVSPAFLETPHSETEDSQGSSPDQERMAVGVSPGINDFSSRAPPDGCERIKSTKSVPLIRPIPLDPSGQPRSIYKLRPSSHSAFESLNKSVEDTQDSIPIVPSQDDLN